MINYDRLRDVLNYSNQNIPTKQIITNGWTICSYQFET